MDPMVEVNEVEETVDKSNDELMHYGMPRRSGRYPWGSGEDGYQHNRDFLSRVEELRKDNFTFTDEQGKKWNGDTAIAKSLGLSTTQFRTELALAKDERRMLQVARAKSLREDGKGFTEIGKEMGINESSVRSLLKDSSEVRMKQAQNTANFLKERLNEVADKGGMLDIGTNVERELGISKEKLQQAVYLLEREGYVVHGGRMPQPTNPGQFTTQKVLCLPGTEHKEIYKYDKIQTVKDYVSHDGGETFDKLAYPKSLNSSRVMIRYDEDGGTLKDGIVEIRRGVNDISLGNDRYSQVRILVDDKKYIKGMAVYSDDIPDGVDVVFNTNKTKSVPKMDVFKDIKDDPDNPFGALIKAGGQSYYTDETGKKQLSVINKTRGEGDWDDWANTLPSQFLGKQSLSMAKKQLKLAEADKLDEFEEIRSLTNPTIKKHLLQKFADTCDAAAVDLKAAALPGQKYHVIIPVNSLKDTEVYAPGYENGTKLALIRYPHGGTFEIPICTVNNKNTIAKKLIGTTPIDAVCINNRVAERLSGADFDGDTVMCIPTHDPAGKVKIASRPSLKGLESFDPKASYPERPGMKYMKDPVTKKDSTQMQMGIISNLITDMTLAGANDSELAAAVRHSMVVIDAAKHKLDYKQSELDNNISALKRKYQAHVDDNGNMHYGGASTILSKAKGEYRVPKRQGSPKVNQKGKEWYDPDRPEGALIYNLADDLTYEVVKTNKRTGTVSTITKTRTQNSTKMAETDDAHILVSDQKHPMELVYADYANSMKALANKARIEMVNTGKIAYSKTAKATYQAEVASLNNKLNTALLNSTRERAATRLANAEVKAKKEANPDMSKSDIKKASQMAVTKYRSEVGSISRRSRNIKITDKEWEAIQAGAISENKLIQILNNTDIDDLRQRATPRTTTTLSTAKINRIKSMSNSNFTIEQIAKSCGVSTSVVSKYLKGAK